MNLVTVQCENKFMHDLLNLTGGSISLLFVVILSINSLCHGSSILCKASVLNSCIFIKEVPARGK